MKPCDVYFWALLFVIVLLINQCSTDSTESTTTFELCEDYYNEGWYEGVACCKRYGCNDPKCN